jgi:hypothetical protein
MRDKKGGEMRKEERNEGQGNEGEMRKEERYEGQGNEREMRKEACDDDE